MTLLVVPMARNGETALMERFCSLGDNCEFGIAQRAFGAEPADLLRWAAISPPTLIRLLEARCVGLADPGALRLSVNGPFYWVENPHYGFGWHGLVRADAMPPATMLQREAVRVARLTERFLAELEDGQRILVVKRRPPAPSGEAEALLEALAAYRPAWLLYVTIGTAPGTVRQASERLLRAELPRFADAGRVWEDTDGPAWLELCRQASALVAASGGVVRT